jgi:hypothetical protein
MAEKSEDIQGVQGIKIRSLKPNEKVVLKKILFSATVSDMRTLVMWSIEEPHRLNYFVERVLDGVAYALALREAEYL